MPGAGKTLVGLNVATRRGEGDASTHAVFLSGNGPLVAVLREALACDEYDRLKSRGARERKGVVRKRVETFIQNVHHFRDYALEDPRPPDDHVVIFDEAQRAWNLKQTESFMLRKKGRPAFRQSEPNFRFRQWTVTKIGPSLFAWSVAGKKSILVRRVSANGYERSRGASMTGTFIFHLG